MCCSVSTGKKITSLRLQHIKAECIISFNWYNVCTSIFQSSLCRKAHLSIYTVVLSVEKKGLTITGVIVVWWYSSFSKKRQKGNWKLIVTSFFFFKLMWKKKHVVTAVTLKSGRLVVPFSSSYPAHLSAVPQNVAACATWPDQTLLCAH